jgi:hypothetical protein
MVKPMTTEQSDQRLPCAICWARGVEGSVGSCGPQNLYCVKCWQAAGGDPQINAACYGTERPTGATVN